MDIINDLKSDNRIIQESLVRKMKRINKLKRKKLEDAKDIEAELRAALKILKIPVLTLKFSERPDIIITTIPNETWGVEVRRIRPKQEDIRDENNFKNEFCKYGNRNTNSWSLSVRDAILDKAESQKTNNTSFLYILSDSPHEIEDKEMEYGIIEAFKSRSQGIPFKGIFYETVFRPLDADFTFVVLDRLFLNTDFYKDIKNTWMLKTKILQDVCII